MLQPALASQPVQQAVATAVGLGRQEEARRVEALRGHQLPAVVEATHLVVEQLPRASDGADEPVLPNGVPLHRPGHVDGAILRNGVHAL
eukprot:11638067-Alexandrium_andersonii.AAC.1